MSLMRLVPASLAIGAIALTLAACNTSAPSDEDIESSEEAVIAKKPKLCPYDILCAPGYHPADTNGDGCPDACLADCPYDILCAPGHHPVDSDYDGCHDACVCDVAVRCAPGYHSVDTDGDGCNDSCEPDCVFYDILCSFGSHPVDTDGDGCSDACVPDDNEK